MEQSTSYWAKRALQREAESYLRGAGLSLKLFTEYQAAAATIRKDIEVFFSRYADDNGMSYDHAMRALNRREMQQWRGTLGQYMDRIDAETDPDMKARLQAELDALAYNSRITRLMALEGQIHLVLNDLFVSGIEQARQEFGDLFSEAYYKRMYDIQNRAGIIFEFAKVDETMIQDVVSYPWSGTEFSGRLWRNRQALVYNLRETITQGLIRGTSAEQMSVQLSDAVGASYKAAERLIRTETNHFHNEASRRAMAAAGVEQYEYMATLDTRTSEQCRKLDGKVFPLEEAQEGENYPPMHPNCRSTVVELDPEEAQDWKESGKTMPKGMTYDEWAKANGIPMEPEPIDGLVGLETSTGIEITGATAHMRKRMMERSIRVADVTDALRKPLVVGKIRLDSHGRPSVRFTGGRAEVAVNPDTGMLLSVNRTHAKRAKKLKKGGT